MRTKAEKFCARMEKLAGKGTPGPWVDDSESMVSPGAVRGPGETAYRVCNLPGTQPTSTITEPARVRARNNAALIVALHGSQEALLGLVRAADVVVEGGGRAESVRALSAALDALPSK